MHLMCPILFIILPEKYKAGTSPQNLTNRITLNMKDDAFKDFRNKKRNVSAAPPRNPRTNTTTKSNDMAGCFTSFSMSLVMVLFPVMCGTLKNIAVIPIITVQTAYPMKHGV